MSTTGVNTEEQKRNREQVLEYITILSPVDRPLMSALGRVDAEALKVEWTKDTLPTRNKDNAVIGGFTVTPAAVDVVVRTEAYNYCQLMESQIKVDDEQEAVNKVGIGRNNAGEMKHQKKKKMDSLLNDNECALISNNDRVQPLSGAGAQAGKLRGIQKWLTTNAVSATANNGDGTIASNKIYHELNHKCWKQGGVPNKVFSGAQAKDAVASFVTQISRPVSDSGKKLMTAIDTYGSSTGTQDLILSRDLTTVLLMIEAGRFDVAWLREPKWKDLGAGGDFEAGFYRDQLTLVAWAEESSGIMTDLNYVE